VDGVLASGVAKVSEPMRRVLAAQHADHPKVRKLCAKEIAEAAKTNAGDA
jgi:hypothetical protein